MLTTIRATVKGGKIELLEPLEMSEGAELLVTVLPDQDTSFWQSSSENALGQVWNNAEDDVYAKLLEA